MEGTKPIKRRLSLNEKIYRVMEKTQPPFAIQYVIKGDGLLNPDKVRSALAQLAQKIPALKLKPIKNRWTESALSPSLTVHHRELPQDLNSSEFQTPINEGCCEFHLFQTDHSEILFRVLHSAMDGQGGLVVLKSLFKVLGDQQLEEINAYPKDSEVRSQINLKSKKKRASINLVWSGLNGPSKSTNYQTEIIRSNEPIDTAIGLIAKWYMDQTNKAAKFLIPVNIRRHQPSLLSVSNLTLPIFLECSPEQNANDIQSSLLVEMLNNNELSTGLWDQLFDHLPQKMIERKIRAIINRSKANGRYPFSGYISDLGNIDLSSLSCNSFSATDFFSVPVYTTASPICVSICHHQAGTRIVFSLGSHKENSKLRESLDLACSKSTALSSRTTENITFIYDEQVLTLWTDILKCTITKEDRNTSFAELGGDSMNLVILINQVGEHYAQENQSDFMMNALKFGKEISPNRMFELLNKYQ